MALLWGNDPRSMELHKGSRNWKWKWKYTGVLRLCICLSILQFLKQPHLLSLLETKGMSPKYSLRTNEVVMLSNLFLKLTKIFKESRYNYLSLDFTCPQKISLKALIYNFLSCRFYLCKVLHLINRIVILIYFNFIFYLYLCVSVGSVSSCDQMWVPHISWVCFKCHLLGSAVLHCDMTKDVR